MRKKTSHIDLLKAGLGLVWENGYEATSVKQICNSADILVGSFYNYYESKEDYVLALLDLYWTQWEEILKDTFENNQLNIYQQFDKLFDDAIERYRNKEFKRGCFAGMLSHELGDTNELFGNKQENLFTKAEQYYITALNKGKENNLINSSREINDMAGFILNSFEGALLRMKSSQSPKAIEICKKQTQHFLKLTIQ